MSLTMQSADKLRVPYIKALLYGETGTGKTTLATKIALGLVQFSKLDKPVYFYDTEESSKAVYDEFLKPAKIKMEVCSSRSLSELKEFFGLAQEKGSVAIVDSISHVWQFTMKNYLDKKNQAKKKKCQANGWNYSPQKRLYMNDWLEIKPAWVECFDDPFLQSRIHVIQCSRSKNLFDQELEDDNNKNSKTLIHVGTAPRTESNSAYEPYLMIEMIREVNPKFQNSPKKERKFTRFAVVTKDKMHNLDGRVLENPGFESIMPHIEKLDIGKEKNEVNLTGSDNLFEDVSGDFEAVQKKKKVCLENIKDGLVRVFPGTGEKEKAKKTTILKALSGQSSWSKWETISVDKLKFYELCAQEIENLYSCFRDIKDNGRVPDTESQKTAVSFFEFKNLPELEKNTKSLALKLSTQYKMLKIEDGITQ